MIDTTLQVYGVAAVPDDDDEEMGKLVIITEAGIMNALQVTLNMASATRNSTDVKTGRQKCQCVELQLTCLLLTCWVLYLPAHSSTPGCHFRNSDHFQAAK